MAREPVSDRLLRALASIDELTKTVGKHGEVMLRLAEQMAQLDRKVSQLSDRLAALEGRKT